MGLNKMTDAWEESKKGVVEAMVMTSFGIQYRDSKISHFLEETKKLIIL